MPSNGEQIFRGNKTEEPFQWGGVLLISVCHFIHDVFSSFFSPLLPLLVEKLSINLTYAGFLGTISQLPALLNPVIGKWADRGNTIRWFIILAPALTSIPMSLLGLAPSYGAVALLLLVVGISTSLFHVPAPVMVAQLSGSRKGQGMSFFMIGGEFSRTVGPVAAVGAVSLWGLEGYYPVMLIGILSSVLIYFRFKDLNIAFKKNHPVPLKKSWGEIKGVMRPLTGILITRGFMHGSLSTFLPIFIKQETGSLWLAGAGLALYEAAGVLGIFSAGPLSDRLGRRRVLGFLLTLAPFFLFLFVILPGSYKVPALVCTGFTLLSTTPVMLAMIQEHAKNSPSAANGFFMMVSFIARSAVVVLVGFCGDLVGLKTTYYICALLGILGIPFLFMLPGKGMSDPSKTV
ncbi:MAG: MFS transporter [Proteobacteria bacterium]|nr:MFS transporter [Pseudomonadota bacterium]